MSSVPGVWGIHKITSMAGWEEQLSSSYIQAGTALNNTDLNQTHWCVTGAQVSLLCVCCSISAKSKKKKGGGFATSSTDEESVKWPPVVFGAAMHLGGTCQSIAKPRPSHLENQQGPS